MIFEFIKLLFLGENCYPIGIEDILYYDILWTNNFFKREQQKKNVLTKLGYRPMLAYRVCNAHYTPMCVQSRVCNVHDTHYIPKI